MITKAVYEETFRTMQFRRPDGGGPLNDDETVTAAEVVCAQVGTEEDTTAEMISDVAPYDNTQVRYLLKGGTKGLYYDITVRCVSSNGQRFEEKLTLKVT